MFFNQLEFNYFSTIALSFIVDTIDKHNNVSTGYTSLDYTLFHNKLKSIS